LGVAVSYKDALTVKLTTVIKLEKKHLLHESSSWCIGKECIRPLEQVEMGDAKLFPGLSRTTANISMEYHSPPGIISLCISRHPAGVIMHAQKFKYIDKKSVQGDHC
jgi:hypothetical protein